MRETGEGRESVVGRNMNTGYDRSVEVCGREELGNTMTGS